MVGDARCCVVADRAGSLVVTPSLGCTVTAGRVHRSVADGPFPEEDGKKSRYVSGSTNWQPLVQPADSPTGSVTLALTYPQTLQAACGSFGFPHFGHRLSVTGVPA